MEKQKKIPIAQNRIIFPLNNLDSIRIKCLLKNLTECHPDILPYIWCFQLPFDTFFSSGIKTIVYSYKQYGDIKIFADFGISSDTDAILSVLENSFNSGVDVLSIGSCVNIDIEEKIKEKLKQLIARSVKLNEGRKKEHEEKKKTTPLVLLREKEMEILKRIIPSSFDHTDVSTVFGTSWKKYLNLSTDRAERKNLDGVIIPYTGLCHTKTSQKVLKISADTPMESIGTVFAEEKVGAVILEHGIVDVLNDCNIPCSSFDIKDFKDTPYYRDGLINFYKEVGLIVGKIKTAVREIVQ